MKEQPAPENLAQDIYEALQAEVFPIGNYAIHIIQKVLDRHEVNTLPIAQQQSVPVSASEYFEKHKVVTVTHEVPFLSQEDFMQYAAQSAPKDVSVEDVLNKWVGNPAKVIKEQYLQDVYTAMEECAGVWSKEKIADFGRYCIQQFALTHNRDENYTERLLEEFISLP